MTNKANPKWSQLKKSWERVKNLFSKAKVTSRVADCGYREFTCESDSSHRILSPGICGSRLCPVCGHKRATRIQLRYGPLVRRFKRPKHITLTMPLTWLGALGKNLTGKKKRPTGIKLLVLRFNQLRKLPVWRGVRGGVYTVHVKLKPGGWHVHLHALVDGWVDNRNKNGRPLETAWCSLTGGNPDAGDRRSVEVRRVKRADAFRVLGYAVDYKEEQLAALEAAPAAVLRELVHVMEGGAHVFGSFGAVRSLAAPFVCYLAQCPICGGPLKPFGGTVSYDNPFARDGPNGTVLYDTIASYNQIPPSGPLRSAVGHA